MAASKLRAVASEYEFWIGHAIVGACAKRKTARGWMWTYWGMSGALNEGGYTPGKSAALSAIRRAHGRRP